MALKLTNNATSKLSAAIGTTDTTLSLTPGDGAKFPTLAAGDWFPVTAIKSDGTIEIMRCTARATDTLTVARAQENTAATAFSGGDRIELRMTAAAFSSCVFKESDGSITIDSGARYKGKDNGGTVRDLLYISDSNFPTLAVSTGTHLRIVNQAEDTELLTCDNTGNVSILGGISTAGNVTATGTISGSNVTATSDEKLKTDWRHLPSDFLERFASVLHGTYTRLDTGERQAGVSAQSLATVLPEAVIEIGDGTLSVAYGHAALVAVIELTMEVLRLRSQMERKE